MQPQDIVVFLRRTLGKPDASSNLKDHCGEYEDQLEVNPSVSHHLVEFTVRRRLAKQHVRRISFCVLRQFSEILGHDPKVLNDLFHILALIGEEHIHSPHALIQAGHGNR